MDVEVRAATPADARAIRAVHLASIEGLRPSAYDERVVAAWAHDRDLADYPIESEKTFFVVAERGGNGEREHGEADGNGEGGGGIVGFGWLAVEPGDHLVSNPDAEVVAVYVHPGVAREGVGSAILADLERAARERKIETLGLWASLPAVPFYRARGYERVTEHVHEFAPDVRGEVVEMRATL